MKNIKQLVYILFCVFVFTSCMNSELDSITPKALKVVQGNIAIQDQSTIIEYGTLRVLKDSVTKNYRIANTSGQILRFSKITSDSQDFFVKLERDTIALFPQEGLNFSVTFSPRKGGVTIGKISFSTNDPAYPVFSFGVKGEGVAPPEIIGNGSPQFEELNTVDLGGGRLGTRFTLELYVEDAYNRINPTQLNAQLKFIYTNGTTPTLIVKKPSELTVSEDKKRILYSFVVHFGTSNFVDIETKLILGNGDVSNVFKTRIERPGGAK